jgi:hypothetical protein
MWCRTTLILGVWPREGNRFTQPKAIMVISAHWLTIGTLVTCMERLNRPQIMYHLLGQRYGTFSSLKGDRASWRVVNDPGSEYGLRGRWAIVQGAVGAEGVVFHSPPSDEYLRRLLQGVENLSIQQFVS